VGEIKEEMGEMGRQMGELYNLVMKMNQNMEIIARAQPINESIVNIQIPSSNPSMIQFDTDL
jgi:hypothetical protein